MTTSPKRPRFRGLANYWYLAYVSVLVFQPMFDPSSSWVDWALAGAAIAVFLPVYVLGERRPGRLRLAMPWLSAALGVVVLTFNTGGGVFLIYAGAAAASHRERPQAMRWLVG